MNIEQEILNIGRDILSRYEVFKATQGTEKNYINIEDDFENIRKQIDEIKSICLSEKRETLYGKVNKLLTIYATAKCKIENIKKSNKDSKQNNSEADNKSKQEKTYICEDQSKIQIKKMNKDYAPDFDKYNFTNPPPTPIDRYQISRIVNTSVGNALIKNEVFSYPIDMERMEQDEKYRSNVINRLLSKENIKKAIEDYGGHVADAFKGDNKDVSEYTVILARRQIERAYDFCDEGSCGTIILPVGEIQLLEDNHTINQYKYWDISKENVHTGYMYGNIDIARMEKDEEYRETILEQLQRKTSIYIGEVDENLRLKEDERIKTMLQESGMIYKDKEWMDILGL